MLSIAIHKRITSDNLFFPELKPFLGKNVLILVSEDKTSKESEADLSNFFKAAGKIKLDKKIINENREISII